MSLPTSVSPGNPSQACPEACLLGDCMFCWVYHVNCQRVYNEFWTFSYSRNTDPSTKRWTQCSHTPLTWRPGHGAKECWFLLETKCHHWAGAFLPFPPYSSILVAAAATEESMYWDSILVSALEARVMLAMPLASAILWGAFSPFPHSCWASCWTPGQVQ